LKKMPENVDFKAALKRAMALCAQREQCSEDIRLKLDSWGINDTDSNKIISTLISENFINEDRYANAFVADKFRNNKWGRVKIVSLLGVKKIGTESIQSAIASIDEDQYKQMIRDILAAHRKSVKAKNQYDLKGKLMRFGLSRGYESNLLYDILNDLK
jgi:regulatory protein